MVHCEGFTAALPRYGLLLRVGFPILLTVLLLGHTLRLPWSIIDEPAQIQWTRDQLAALREGGIAAWWEKTWTPDDQRFGPGRVVQMQLFEWLGGHAPWGWHALKMLLYALTLAAIAELARLGRLRSEAAIFSILAFALFGRPYVFPDCQTHHANWQRLLSTDTFYIPWILWSAAFFLHMLRSEDRARWLFAASSSALFVLASLVKLNVMCFAGPFGLILATRWYRRGDERASLAKLAVLFAMALVPALAFFRPWSPPELRNYSGPDFAPAALLESASYFAWSMTEAWFLFWIAALLWTGMRMRRARAIDESGPDRAWVLLMAGIVVCVGGVQLTWPERLPRYLIAFTPCLALLLGGAADAWLHRWERAFPEPPRLPFRRSLLPLMLVGGAAWLLAAASICVVGRGGYLRWLPVLALLSVASTAVCWNPQAPDGARSWLLQRIRAAALLGLVAFNGAALFTNIFEDNRVYSMQERARWQIVEAAVPSEVFPHIERVLTNLGPTNLDGVPGAVRLHFGAEALPVRSVDEGTSPTARDTYCYLQTPDWIGAEAPRPMYRHASFPVRRIPLVEADGTLVRLDGLSTPPSIPIPAEFTNRIVGVELRVDSAAIAPSVCVSASIVSATDEAVLLGATMFGDSLPRFRRDRHFVALSTLSLPPDAGPIALQVSARTEGASRWQLRLDPPWPLFHLAREAKFPAVAIYVTEGTNIDTIAGASHSIEVVNDSYTGTTLWTPGSWLFALREGRSPRHPFREGMRRRVAFDTVTVFTPKSDAEEAPTPTPPDP